MGYPLGGADAAFVVAATALLLAAGAVIGGKPRTALEFLIGRTRAPAWAAGLSLTSAEISGVTLLAVPAAAYGRDWALAQFFLGSALARLFLAWKIVPALHRSGSLTVYAFLRSRLGPRSEAAAAWLFLLARLVGAGARLMIASAALSTLLGWPPGTAAAMLALAAAAYLGYGGLGAAVWAGAVQALVLIAAGLGLLGFLVATTDGGPGLLWHAVLDGGRLRLWDFVPSEGGFWRALLADGNFFWTAVAGGFFTTLGGVGADQEMMQRLLATPRAREAQKALLIGLAGSFVFLLLFLTAGSALFAFYELHPGFSRPFGPDQILPHFAATVMPASLRALVIAAVAAAAVDLPLVSCAAVFLADIHRVRPAGQGPEHDLRLARGACGAAAAAILVVAALCADPGLTSWFYQASNLASGPLFGALLLALTPGAASDSLAAAGLWVLTLSLAALLNATQGLGVPLAPGWLAGLGMGGMLLLPRVRRYFAS